MKSLTIANCGFHTFISHQGYVHSANVSLFVADVNNFTLDWVSVQNGSVFGLCLVNTFDVLIVNSNFANNKGPKDLGGNALIVYDDHHKGVFRVNIVKSNFTLGLLTSMDLWYGNDIKAEVVIENCTFSHNIVKVGGGVYIVSYGTGSIEFRNCTLYNNTASVYGGGVYFRSRGNVSIEFQDCTIYAQHDGGGVYIDSHGNSHMSSIIALYTKMLLNNMEEECILIQMGIVVLCYVTALYTTILFGILEEEEECTFVQMEKMVALSFITAQYSTILLTMMEEEEVWLLIY